MRSISHLLGAASLVSLSLRTAVLVHGAVVGSLASARKLRPSTKAGTTRPAHLGQGGGDVVVAHQTAVFTPRLDARSAHDQREVGVLLVGLELAVPEAVLSEVGPVVGVEDEVGVVHLALAPEQV